MQDDKGYKRILAVPSIYDLFQSMIGVRGAGQWMAQNFWRLKGGEKVVDIGCGSGTIRDFLPQVIHYVGFDISEAYIQAARRNYGSKGDFFVGTTQDFLTRKNSPLLMADLVMCNGLLHHLNDQEVIEVLELARQILKPQGRFVAIEPVFLLRQDHVSQWIMSRDRGMNVRYEEEWKTLINPFFPSFSSHILTGLFRIPYIHIVLECVKP